MRTSISHPIAAVLLAVFTGGGCAADTSETAPAGAPASSLAPAPAGAPESSLAPAPAGDEQDVGKLTAEVTVADFTTGQWSLRVDRSLNLSGPVRFSSPSDALVESDYVPAAEATVFPIAVSGGGSAIAVSAEPEVAREPMLGSSENTADPLRRAFDLKQGTFAGGRFLIWQAAGALQAELTLYGSGLPIVRSWRGDLVRER